MYVDYEFYQLEWGGKAPMTDFVQLNIQATKIIDYYTFNRLKELGDVSNDVKYAICELIDDMHRLKATGGKEVASEKVGTHSITYATSDSAGDAVKKKQKDIVKKWLGHTGLMYRGVYP